VITASEIMVMLNVAWSDAERLDRIDDLAGEIADGHLKVESDLDTIVALTLTSGGRKLLKPMLPTASS
jgi:hypothetical protein